MSLDLRVYLVQRDTMGQQICVLAYGSIWFKGTQWVNKLEFGPTGLFDERAKAHDRLNEGSLIG